MDYEIIKEVEKGMKRAVSNFRPPIGNESRTNGTIAADVPVELVKGMRKASKRFGLSQADIVRSLVYDFLLNVGAIEPLPQFEGDVITAAVPVTRVDGLFVRE